MGHPIQTSNEVARTTAEASNCADLLIQSIAERSRRDKSMGTRWKGKNNAAIAESNPMSHIVTQLQASLTLCRAQAMLSGHDVLFEATPELAELLNRSCFSQEISTCEKGKQWFQFGLKDAFYLHHQLQVLTIIAESNQIVNGAELWVYMSSEVPRFAELYKAYVHLRTKNWVVRSGTQYGGDLVAYRHHSALVHSEYVVLVMLEGDDASDSNMRLRVWSDLQCSLRVSGSMAKTLLVLSIDRNKSDVSLPSCLEQFAIEESTIERWVPEQCRKENSSCKRSVKEQLWEENCVDEDES